MVLYYRIMFFILSQRLKSTFFHQVMAITEASFILNILYMEKLEVDIAVSVPAMKRKCSDHATQV